MTDLPEGYQEFPAFRYGPKGASQIFDSEEQVPEGWVDHPSKLDKKSKAKPEQTQTFESPYKDMDAATLITELKKREGVEFHPKWPRERLEQTLLDDDAAKAKEQN